MRGMILALDQSTQGTKGMLFDETGALLARRECAHRQIVTEQGWVEHDPEEIYRNVLRVADALLRSGQDGGRKIAAVGICNQRETVMCWNGRTGKPIYNAIVWQCGRGSQICARMQSYGDMIRQRTGLNLSPFFSAAKLAWIMQNVPEAKSCADRGVLRCGTMDTWLLYRLTGGRAFKTDYSNASRTQLFHIDDLCWDETLCGLFGIPMNSLPEVCMSDSVFGETDLEGLLAAPVPICAVMGDSHAALFGHGCLQPGELKATYGTGSSVMMNTGSQRVAASEGLVSSIAWGRNKKVSYVLEGNLNYTGAVISWLKNDLQLIGDAAETEALALAARDDATCIVPAFSGLGAPYWDSSATGIITGITRTTGKKEIVRAALECICFQINDLLQRMGAAAGLCTERLNVDGGAVSNAYLMQFQSNVSKMTVAVPAMTEQSGAGAAYMAGIGAGIYPDGFPAGERPWREYRPNMAEEVRAGKLARWQAAVEQVLRGHS